MCTFLITNNTKISNTRKLQQGGPDSSIKSFYKNYSVIHNLLWITGEKTNQPYRTERYDFYLLGEMYNWDSSFNNELSQIASLFLFYEEDFTRYIEGEFLIIVIDKQTSIIHFFTDPWATRGCYLSIFSDYWYISTFPFVGVETTRLSNNSYYTWDGSTLLKVDNSLHKWDLTQHKNSLEDIHETIDLVAREKWHKDALVLLSGGIDSSVITASLQTQNLPVSVCSFDYKETEDSQNLEIIKNYCSIHSYHWLASITHSSLLEEIANQEYCKKVVIAGNEADGVFDNYRNKKLYSYEEFDQFPEDLSTIFPWSNFYNGVVERQCPIWEKYFLQRGVEARHFYLDKRLAQEFLWLSPKLKNMRTKHFLKSYLEEKGIYLDYSTHVGFLGHNITYKVQERSKI